MSASTQHYKVAVACRYWLVYSEAFLILKWFTIAAFLHASTNIYSVLQERWMNGGKRDKVMFYDQNFLLGLEELPIWSTLGRLVWLEGDWMQIFMLAEWHGSVSVSEQLFEIGFFCLMVWQLQKCKQYLLNIQNFMYFLLLAATGQTRICAVCTDF